MKKFVCSVCGYVHTAEELAADFRCPVCKVPASKFVEQKGEMKLAAEHEYGVYAEENLTYLQHTFHLYQVLLAQ